MKLLLYPCSDQLLGLSALGDVEVCMSEPENDETIDNGFIRHSAIHSTCESCLLTIRSRTPELLELAEDIHCQFCPANRRLPIPHPL